MASREQATWVFRHIGPPATIPESVEIVELKPGATTFGRGAAADAYIDSKVLRNFISRRHAIVVGERNQDNQLQFILHNYGLNGTYVNDVRIGQLQHLQEGDRITFGHKNGYKVKVGETALQPDSEFQFVLERGQLTASCITPLHKQRQQDGAKGETCVSEADTAKGSVYTPRRNGQAAASQLNLQHTGGVGDTAKTLTAKNIVEGCSRLTSRTSSETRRAGSPWTDHQNNTKTKHENNTGRKDKTFTGNTSPKVKEVHSAEEGKARASSKSARRRYLDKDNGTAPHRRHSDDGVPSSFQCKITRPSPGQSHVARRSWSSSPKRRVSTESKSPKRIEKSKLPTENDECRLEKSFGQNSRPRSSCEVSQNRSRSPSPSRSPGKSAERRSASSRRSSSDYLPMSPRPELSDCVLPGSERTGHCRSPNSAGRRSESPREDAGRPRSQSRDAQRSPSLYDEPPQLIPEYVRTPSSVMRTPSPCISMERGNDEEYDETDDMDRDQFLCGVPPTPGHSFLDLSPSPHRGRLESSPRTFQDVSFPGGRGWDMSSGGSGHLGPSGNQRSGSKKTQGSVWCEAGLADRPRDSVSCGQAVLDSRGKDRDQDPDISRLSNVSRHLVEPDSTTPSKDTSGSGSGKRRINSRSSKGRSGSDSGRERKDSDTGKEKNGSDGSKARNDSDSGKGRISSDGSKERKGSDSDKERTGSDCSKRRTDCGSGRVTKPKRKNKRGDCVLSDYKHSWYHSKGDDPHLLFSSFRDLSYQQEDESEQVRQKGKEFSVGNRNVFDDFSSAHLDKSKQQWIKKRLHSTESDVDGEQPGKPRPKSSKLNHRTLKSHGEKENGLTTDDKSPGRPTGHSESHREQHPSDGKLLKAVRVSVSRVTPGSLTSDKQRTAGRDHKQQTRQFNTSVSDGSAAHRDKRKSPARISKTNKPGSREDRDEMDTSDDTSLFGLQLEKLGSMQSKDRRKTWRQKPAQPRGGKPVTPHTESTRDSNRGGKPATPHTESTRDSNRGGKPATPHTESTRDSNRGGKPATPHTESTRDSNRRPLPADKPSMDRVREKIKNSSPEKPKERKAQKEEDEDGEKFRPMRKIANRKPRLGKDSDVRLLPQKQSEQEDKKAGRPSKKRKRRRKKTGDDDGDEDDDSLEDGVTWYEEETCESDHCHRPSERRVQWVCCDDCDKWYHTVCVGIHNLEDLKDEDYHCGCV